MRAATKSWFDRSNRGAPQGPVSRSSTGDSGSDPVLGGLEDVAAQMGAEIHPLGEDAWVVQSSRVANPKAGPVQVQNLDDRTWVVQRSKGGVRNLRRIGPPKARTHLVSANGAAQRHARQIQQGISDYAGEAHIAWMLRRLEINVVLDVGANVGQFATKLREHGYEGRIISFEPLAELAEVLQKKSADDPDWQVLNYALGEEDGTAEINARPGAMSSLLPSSDFGESWHENLRKSRKETIQLRRLDSVYDDAVAGVDDPKVYLKLDTQGFDLPAFKGAGDVVKQVRAMQSEVSCVPIYDGMPKLHETLPVYEEAGFAINGMFPVNFDGPTARVIEFDMVLIRDESAD